MTNRLKSDPKYKAETTENNIFCIAVTLIET